MECGINKEDISKRWKEKNILEEQSWELLHVDISGYFSAIASSKEENDNI